MAYFPENARSELVTPRNFSPGGVVEIIRMFHAACAASQRPAESPTRGSGVGMVADTIGLTGAGITAGGGVGGGGGLPRPRPPRPPAASLAAAAGAPPDAGADAAGAGAEDDGAAAGGGGDGCPGAGAVAAAAGGLEAAGDAGLDFGAHATASMPTASDVKTSDLMLWTPFT